MAPTEGIGELGTVLRSTSKEALVPLVRSPGACRKHDLMGGIVEVAEDAAHYEGAG